MRILTAGALLALATSSHAQTLQHCASRAAVIERLSEMYGETRRSIGLGANNAVIEVYASDETGTWTITLTTAAGITCLVASGSDFATLTAAPPQGDPL